MKFVLQHFNSIGTFAPLPFALCPLLLAPCPLLLALCSLPFALCSLLLAPCSLLFAQIYKNGSNWKSCAESA